MRIPVLTCLLALGSVQVLASPLFAGWEPTGLPLCGPPCKAGCPQVLPDGDGGAFVAWADGRDSPGPTGIDIYLQRFTPDGQISSGWPTEGLAVCTAVGSQDILSISPDGSGGVLLAWEDSRNCCRSDIYVHRILADGTPAPGWLTNGVSASPFPKSKKFPAVTSDGVGGAFVAWEDRRDLVTNAKDIYAQHLRADGTIHPEWPLDGLPICTDVADQGGVTLLPDGTGGVLAVWSDGRDPSSISDTYALRLSAEGTRPEGWEENGSPLVINRATRVVIPDGKGGLYVAVTVLTPDYFDGQYYVNRFTMDGEVAEGWPVEGVRVCNAPGDRTDLEVAPDGMGGLVLSWVDYRSSIGGSDIYVSHVRPEAVLAPGIPPDGLLVSDPTLGIEIQTDVETDGAGGLYVSWEWETSRRFGKLQHIVTGGTVAPGWPLYGEFIAETSLSQFFPTLVTDEAGGVYAVWEERDHRAERQGLFAAKFAADGPVPIVITWLDAEATAQGVKLSWYGKDASRLMASVYRRDELEDWQRLGAPATEGPDRLYYEDRQIAPGASYAYRLGYRSAEGERFSEESWVTVPSGATLSLAGFQPNPAQGNVVISFSLASAERATLEVVDVRGRVVLLRAVGSLGPGSHTVDLTAEGPLRPGVYWVRLKQGADTLTKRGVVLR
jgi:hypothetical protein